MGMGSSLYSMSNRSTSSIYASLENGIDIFFRHETDRGQLLHALFPEPASLTAYTSWYKEKTIEFVLEHSYKIQGVPGTRVDIVRNVINLVSVHWVADWLIGIPLKTKANPKGLFTEQELYDMLTILFQCVFINVQPEHGWALRHGAKQVGDIVLQMIEKSLNEASPKTASVCYDSISPVLASDPWAI